MSSTHTRRSLLKGAGLAGMGALAGCSGTRGGPAAIDDGRATDAPSDDTPSREDVLYQPWDHERVRDGVVSGGPGKDGIPSVDEPSFAPADDVTMSDDEIVFGYAGGTDVAAYPQRVLVWHEITNVHLDGRNVAVTYCPLTGTAMGFERGETTFGVSGDLVNNNLVMYDRETDSRWPQMLATAVEGPREGTQLREFRLVWTTWGDWRAAHPATVVMTEDTGYARRYGSDPYGTYNPIGGYYAGGNPLFRSLTEDDRAEDKRVVIGARTSDRAVAFDKPALREAGVLTTDDGAFVAAYDADLDTGWVYRVGEATVEGGGQGRVVVDGEGYAADSLPLPPVYAFDAMWHAWAGFYPMTAYAR